MPPDRPLRVLFVTAYWPSDAEPYDGIFVYEHARAAATRADVRVVCLRRVSAAKGVVAAVERDDPDLPTIEVYYRRLPPPLSYGASLVGLVEAVRRLRNVGFRPDVVHAHQLVSVLPALVLGRILRVPVAYTEHWTIFMPENPFELSRVGRLAAAWALRRAEVVLPVSHAWARAARALAPSAHFRVVPNVVDETVFVRRDRYARRGDELRLITVSHLNEGAKGIDVLLRAVAQLRNDGHDVCLEIIGKGDGEADYRALASGLGVAERVTFGPEAPKAWIAERMQAADLLVLASRFENSPCTIIEAFATGLPVVATAVGGVPELVDESSGVLARPGSVDSLVTSIEQAAARLDDFDRAAISRRATERYGRERIGRELEDVYCSLTRAASR
jgi:glycosyltransferase involved in cell wall biosynthesis